MIQQKRLSMKKYFIPFLSIVALWLVTACRPDIPEIDDKTGDNDTTTVTPVDTTTTPTDTTIVTPVDTTVVPPVDSVEIVLPESFPRKHIIEEFTGQDCGYCPYGMDCVHQFTANDTNWIVVLHHYGYAKDHFSVAGSQSITNKLRVNGAPTVAIDRAATRSGDGNKTCFHPGYLPDVSKSQFESSTYASLNITTEYDAVSRKLNVHLGGLVVEDDKPALVLTVLVKESGMIDYQADYYATYKGWQEFRHANAVRAYLSAPLGDNIQVNDAHAWQADYELDMNSNWIPENCAVVAMLSEGFNPIVQAGQCPVVSGTTGGVDILHGGITAVPVEDYYPEPGSDIAPMTFSGRDADTLNVAYAYYTPNADQNFNYWQIQAYSSTQTVKVGNTECVPFADFYLFTRIDKTELTPGTYKFSTTTRPGTAYAGFRDDEQMLIDGSMYYYTSKAYFNQGYLSPVAQWLIADGTLTITSKGWSIVGHARNGTAISLYGSSPIVNQGIQAAPQRVRARHALTGQKPVMRTPLSVDQLPAVRLW